VPAVGTVHEDLVAGVDQPVEQGFGDDRVREAQGHRWTWVSPYSRWFMLWQLGGLAT